MAEFFLRFLKDDGKGRVWLRRDLFATAWSKVALVQLASPFKTHEEALAFAQAYRLAGDVELVTLTREELRR